MREQLRTKKTEIKIKIEKRRTQGVGGGEGGTTCSSVPETPARAL
jgi:hypothetical protein